MPFPIAAAVMAGGSILGGMLNKPKPAVQTVPLLPSNGGTQQPMQPPQQQQMGLGDMLSGGQNIMGALSRRKEAVQENPTNTLKTGIEAINTMPDLKPDEKNMYLQKIYEAYQKSQNMG